MIEQDLKRIADNSDKMVELLQMLVGNSQATIIEGVVDDRATVVETAAPTPAAETVTPTLQAVPTATVEAAAAVAEKITMTEKAGGATYQSFIDKGWSREQIIAEGYAVEGLPAETASVMTLDEANDALVAEAGRIADGGTSIFAMLKEDYNGATSLSEIDPSQYRAIIDKVKQL